MRRTVLVVLAAVLIVVSAVAGVVLHDRHVQAEREAAEDAARARLPPLQAADPAIQNIEVAKPMVTLWTDVTKAPDIAGNIDIAADEARTVGKALKRGVSDDLKGVEIVRFVFRAEAINRFGHDVMATLMTVDFTTKDLKAGADAKLNRGQVLALSYSAKLGAPGAYDARDAWCADPARSNAKFCKEMMGQ